MKFGAYREVLALAQVRTIILLGVLGRVGQFGFGVLLTVHLVETLGRTYSSAGIVTAVWTIGIAVSGPWRGSLLDRIGLRRTMVPSLVVLTPVFLVLPFVRSYWLLLVLAGLMGLIMFPTFAVIRQGVIAATPPAMRRTAISLDSTTVEICFMIGPALAVFLATTFSTTWALFGFGLITIVGALAPVIANFPIVSPDEAAAPTETVRDGRRGRFAWATPQVLGILAASGVAGFILAGTDIGVVAALRGLGSPELIGLTLALWGLGSAITGLAYGGLHRPIPLIWLVLGLGLTTGLVALANDVVSLNVFLLLAGAFCAPTLVAAQDSLQRVVAPSERGQLLGWQGSFMTAGNTMAPPLVGLAMDLRGWHAGFVLAGGVGLVLGLALLALQTSRRRGRTAPLAA
ncbi:MFS transporter [Aestuariimicrobium soli]|uniref:MFS transporter n=1 Tax=Aestuariimicrobium soli TaxID=2035834 RepID=UPI003EBE5FBE